MSSIATTARLLEQARQLTIPDRIKLAEAIWDSVAEDADAAALALPDSHREELDRRLMDSQEKPDDEAEWSEVRERLNRRR